MNQVNAVGPIGLMLLDTAFERPPGDLGRPDSYPVAVMSERVPGALASAVVRSARDLASSELLPRFVAAAQGLQAQGARALTTSCGFLVLWQSELQAAVSVPVVSSSLLAIPFWLREHPQVGVLTIDAQALGADHLRAAGVPESRLGDVLVQGLCPDSHFVAAILQGRVALDVQQACQDVLWAAQALQRRAPHLRSVVLECTNLPPYEQALIQATGWQTLSLLNSSRLLGAAARPLASTPAVFWEF